MTALAFAAVPVASAYAAGGADVDAYFSFGDESAAVGSAAVLDFGVYDDGPQDASNVTVQFSATGGTITSVTPNDDSQDDPSCSDVTDSCSVAVLSDGNASDMDVDVARGSDGTATVTETVTTGSSDLDDSNNSTYVDVDFTTPPAASFTAVSATPDSTDAGVTLQATLQADGSDVSGEEVDVYVKPKGAANSAYVELSASSYTGDDGVHEGTVHITVEDYITSDGRDVSASLPGPVTFELVHPADPDAGAASATVDVTPRPVTATVTVPKALTYGHADDITIKGSATVSDHPGVPLYGTVVLQSRLSGSGAAWQNSSSTNQGDSSDALFFVGTNHNTDYRLVYVSDGPGSASATSPVGTLPVKQRVKAVASPAALPPGGTSSVTVTVGPADHGGKVTLEKRTGGSWKKIHHGSLSASSKQSWSRTYHHLGSASYRVVATATSRNDGNTSSAQKVTIEKHGGGKPKDHTFLYSYGDGYARWNPCHPIHYEVNTKEAPNGALADVKETLRRISQASKLHFVYDGKTKDIPRQGKPQHEPAVIAWARPDQTNVDIGGGVIGVGGGQFAEYGTNPPVVTTGYAVLLAGAKLDKGFGSGTTEGDLLMHELGHMVGLDHVTQTSQIMYPIINPHHSSIYGAGDYRGLQLVGRSQGCLKAPPKQPNSTAALIEGAPQPRVFAASAS